MRTFRDEPMPTPLREIHDRSGKGYAEIISPECPVKSREHLHIILRRGTQKFEVLEYLASVYSVPIREVADAALRTADAYAARTKSLVSA